MEVKTIPIFKEGCFYLAVARNPKVDITKKESWEVIQYTKDGFLRTGNLNKYPLEYFAKVVQHPITDVVAQAKLKIKNLLLAEERRIKQKSLRKDHQHLIDQLLKLTYGLVDNIQGDLPMMGNDLESANARLVSIVTQLKDAGVEP